MIRKPLNIWRLFNVVVTDVCQLVCMISHGVIFHLRAGGVLKIRFDGTIEYQYGETVITDILRRS